jgi:hypothetical protein
MARESAHQLGTPLSSLHGWMEVLRERAGDPLLDGALRHMDADLERLERVAHRFERIGRPPAATRSTWAPSPSAWSSTSAAACPRWPRRCAWSSTPRGDRAHRRGPGALEWVLESLIKNAVDALAGLGGTITVSVRARARRPRAAHRGRHRARRAARTCAAASSRPASRTKERGWGIGLALTRRIVEETHGGTLRLVPSSRARCSRLSCRGDLFAPPAAVAGLNPAQREAVAHDDGPCSCSPARAPARRACSPRASRASCSERGVRPSEILAVTFTNKAAGEMRERIARSSAASPSGHVDRHLPRHRRAPAARATPTAWAHARLHDLRQDDDARDRDQAADGEAHLTPRSSPPRRWPPRSPTPRTLVTPAEYAATARDPLDAGRGRRLRALEADLRSANAVSFDDLLVLPVRAAREHPDVRERYQRRFRYVLVDEYQDTNRAQYEFVTRAGGAHGNVVVVGDDDQSIYGWRGADIRNILDFERTFPARAGRAARGELPLHAPRSSRSPTR